MSGAGKSTALHVLEDLGWETIDNFPVRLLKRLLSSEDEQTTPLAIGVDSRTRGFIPAKLIKTIEGLSEKTALSFEVLFLDSSSAEIERRYNETRRRHPLADGRPVLDGIKAERELLQPLRAWAEMVVDTTDYTSNQLQQVLRERFAPNAPKGLSLTVTSFGFSRGMPPLADLVFDMRFLDNPHWFEQLRELTGLDAPVGEYIEGDEGFRPELDRIRDLILSLLPRYTAQGRAYLTIGFGCTGGRHRSVYTAETIGSALREAGYHPTILHRNLDTRVTDTIEGKAPADD
jgi:UPF0042 nucleotide-binding protein